jgi:hypothetical protein
MSMVESSRLRRIRRRVVASVSPSSLLSMLHLCAIALLTREFDFRDVAALTANPSSPLRSSRFITQRRSSPSDENSDDPSISALDVPKKRSQQPYRALGPIMTKQMDDTLFRNVVQWFAELSLMDYQWRTGLFKSTEADRMVEQSLARMRGEEHATYIRPMDAPEPGPLGRLERQSVSWLSDVFDEEGRRAQKIVALSGTLVRPSDNKGSDDGFSSSSTLGPLGRFEKSVVEFWTSIRIAEIERARTNTWRPKDLAEPVRGPIGQFEYVVSNTLDEIRMSEMNRAQQIKQRGGSIVRPIDIPGPLGELELQVSEVIQAEFRRVREKRSKGTVEQPISRADLTQQLVVLRPKDASYPGPLGKAEANAYEAIQSVSLEEIDRLKSIQRTIIENRPINSNRESLLGTIEAIVVGVFRAPQLLLGVFSRVQELLSSSELDPSDMKLLQEKKTEPSSSQQLPPDE